MPNAALNSCLVKPEEARNVIRVIESAYLSNKEKRTVDFSIK